MPNGHGGVPRFGAPILLWGLGSVLYLSEWLANTAYYRPVLLGLAAGFAWKLAEHTHYWHVLQYGGSRVTPEEATQARVKMVVGSLVYAMIAGFFVLVLTD